MTPLHNPPSPALPHGYALRPAAPPDLEPVLALMAAQNTADYGEPMVAAHSLQQAWEAPDFDLAADARVTLAPGGEVIAYAEVRGDPASGDFEPAVYVAAGHRRRGIGAALLRLAEARALACLPAASARGIRLTTRASERNPGAIRVLERAGYRTGLTFSIMEIVMGAAPAPPPGVAGAAIRPFLPGQDEQATYQADEAASEDKGYHSPLTFEAWAGRMGLRAGPFDPGLWFLACEGEQIVGVALNQYSAETETGWVDHLGVRREWRNRGLGRALLLRSFGEFYQRGIRRVRLSVDSGSLTNAPRLYREAGMRTILHYHIYSRELAGAP